MIYTIILLRVNLNHCLIPMKQVANSCVNNTLSSKEMDFRARKNVHYLVLQNYHNKWATHFSSFAFLFLHIVPLFKHKFYSSIYASVFSQSYILNLTTEPLRFSLAGCWRLCRGGRKSGKVARIQKHNSCRKHGSLN